MAQPAAKAYYRTTVYLTDEQRQWLLRPSSDTKFPAERRTFGRKVHSDSEASI
jgi:hypothetical protein